MSGKGKRPGGPGEGDTFERKTFSVSRLADFATIPELTKQTGQPVENWLLAIVKELVDNALDEAEAAGTAPEIEIVVTDDSIMVADRGRGIAPALVKSLVDYSVRTSSNAAYVSPTRGQQGNALQSILPMGYVLAPGDADAAVLIESQGVAHTIRFSIDPLRETPVVDHVKERSAVKNRTRVTVRWPEQACSLIAAAEGGFLRLIAAYRWVNPHLKLTAEWRGDSYGGGPATDPGWTKWRPDMPTSAHWYDEARLSRLMAAYIADAEDRRSQPLSVRDFISLFRGLKGTQIAAAICETLEIVERETLADFYARPGAAALLVQAMCKRSRPVKPRDLGVIGSAHLQARLVEQGCAEEGVVYRKAEIDHDGLPYMIEVAFGYRGEDDDRGRLIAEGFNFSPAIGGSPFDLQGLLGQAQIERDDPVIVFIHAASPRLAFLDRGKARVALPHEVAERLADLVISATAKWTKQKRGEIRSASAALRRWDAMSKRERPTTIKDAAYAVMVEAYTQASDDGEGGTLPVKPRQIMYRARGSILETTGKETFDDDYFTQEILVDFMRDNPELTADWDVIWDDRGHFAEPHTGHDIGLGTLPVREYIEGFREPVIEPVSVADAHVSTFGPAGRYHAVLFVEKEGFEPIFQAAGIYERYDLAPSSSKGMSNTATRTLVEELCGKRGLPLLVLHDFDKAGFSIHQTLVSDTDRYQFERPLENVVELGLRLADVERLGLQSERVAIKANEKDAARKNLRDNGATEREIAFLIDGLPDHDNQPRRVELNALTSRQLVNLVEAGLIAQGVGKVTPPQETLAGTYAAFKRGAMAKAALEAELARLNAEPVDVPDDIVERVRAYLVEHREETWDDAVRAVMDEER